MCFLHVFVYMNAGRLKFKRAQILNICFVRFSICVSLIVQNNRSYFVFVFENVELV